MSFLAWKMGMPSHDHQLVHFNCPSFYSCMPPLENELVIFWKEQCQTCAMPDEYLYHGFLALYPKRTYKFSEIIF